MSARVRVVPAGLGARRSTATLYTSPEGSWGDSLFEEDGATPGATVDLLPLADIVAGAPPDIVKCNAEGAEYQLIDQLAAEPWRPALLVVMVHPEFGDPESFEQQARALGYRLERDGPAGRPLYHLWRVTPVPDRSLRHLLVCPAGVARRARRLARRWSDGPPPEAVGPHGDARRPARLLRHAPVAELDAVECSSTTHADFGWRSHQVVRYPDLDLTDPPDEVPTYDVVICEQVLEHVTDPWASAHTLRRLCRPDGYVVVSTPFLLKIHDAPGDYWRFTRTGCACC
jgi:SAM-dependent methyltransferase